MNNKQFLTTGTAGLVTEKTVDGKKYVIRSVFVGTKDIQKAILELAEKKAAKDMGLT